MAAQPSRFTLRTTTTTGVASVLLLAGIVAGCAQAPAAAAPSSPAASAAAPAAAVLFLHVDTVLGTKNLTDAEKPAKSCVMANRFGHNEQIVWRVRVMDPVTGTALDDKGLTSLKVKFADQSLDLKYGPHPKTNPVDSFWAGSWLVPAGYPTGSLGYTVVATATDGRTGTFEQFKVPSAMVTITDDVRTPIGG